MENYMISVKIQATGTIEVLAPDEANAVAMVKRMTASRLLEELEEYGIKDCQVKKIIEVALTV